MISLQQIQTWVDQIAEQFHPQQIVLYGSYAHGTPREDSDVDLLVVMPCTENPIDQGLKIKWGLKLPSVAHVLVKPPEEVAWRYEGYDPLIRSALDQGKVLYGQP